MEEEVVTLSKWKFVVANRTLYVRDSITGVVVRLDERSVKDSYGYYRRIYHILMTCGGEMQSLVQDKQVYYRKDACAMYMFSIEATPILMRIVSKKM